MKIISNSYLRANFTMNQICMTVNVHEHKFLQKIEISYIKRRMRRTTNQKKKKFKKRTLKQDGEAEKKKKEKK